MSATIDSRVVELKFDNAQFEAGVRQTLNSLDSLNKGLKLEGASKGLNDVAEASKRFSLGNIADGVDKIASKFTAMSAIAVTALATITNKAVNAGLQIGKALTIQPVTQGLQEYETNLNAIQTILANTKAAGTNLGDVNKALNELNTYSDQTIYNFSEMAKNIGTFTAAGVDLKTATGSIKGIANLAALSGSNSQQASTAMYQLSQAISAGRVSLQDWNSVVNAGMGGTVFQRALAQTAEKMGTLEKGSVKLSGKMKNATINGKSFRESITAKPGEESWLTSEVLTATLEQFTGDLTDAELKAQGFSAAQIKAIQDQAKTAKSAATEVKTLSQLYGTLQEAAGSGWAQTWQLIFGDFNEAKKLWTGVNNVLGGFIQRSSDARNKVLGDWKALNGRTALLEGIKNVFEAIMSVLKPIKDAFRSIFPATTGKQLAELSQTFFMFTQRLKIGGETADRLKRTFAGVFAVFGIAWEVIKQVGRVVGELFGKFSQGEGSFLKITASIGDFLVALHEAIKNGEGLTKFFDKISFVLQKPIELLQKLGAYIAGIFSGFDDKASAKLDSLAESFDPLEKAGQAVGGVWDVVMAKLQAVGEFFAGLGAPLVNFFSNLGKGIQEGVANLDFDKVIAVINTGLLAGALLIFKKFTKNVEDGVGGLTGLLDKVTSPFEALTSTLGEMQKTLKAATLLQIAAAIGIMAAATVALSKVDEKGLKRALGAMTVMFVQLAAAMAVFQKINIGKGMGQLILMAAALRILTSSVVALSQLSWEDLAKGLTGVTALLATLTTAAMLMPDGKKMISSSTGLVIMAGAIKILVSAVTDLSVLSWEDLSKGLVGVGALLASLALFTKLSSADKGGVLQGAGLLLMAFGIKILADAVIGLSGLSWEEISRGLGAMAGGLVLMAAALKLVPPSSLLSAAAIFVVASSLSMIGGAIAKMGGLEWGQIARGLTTMGGALLLIAAALRLLPPSSILSAAALFVVAASLGMIVDALGIMGNMSVEQIAKGLITLGASLAIIAGAVYLMSGALAGAAALIIVAGALALIGPVIQAFGEMSLAEIGKSLLMLAGVFVVLGLAGLALTPVIPQLLLLGIAVGLMGVGMMAAGVGILAFSVALIALSAAAGLVVVGLTTIVAGIIGLIPMIVNGIGLMLVGLAEAIGAAVPAIIEAITKLIVALLDAIVKLTPKVVLTLLVMLQGLLNAIVGFIPRVVDAGMRLITGILSGIAKNIPKIAKSATDVIVAFLNAIGKNAPRIVDAGMKMVIDLVNGIANSIRRNAPAMNAAGRNLASAIVEGLVNGVKSGIGLVVDAAKNLAKGALDAAKNFLGIHSPSREFAKLGSYSAQGFAKGLTGDKAAITGAISMMKSLLSDTMKASKEDIAQAEARLKKLTSARHKDYAAIKKTKAALAQARAEYAKSNAAMRVANTFADETKKLQSLAGQLDKVKVKLADANKALEDAKKTRDDYNKSVTDQYSKLPDISKDTKLTDYISTMEKQIADTQIFTAQLQKLRSMGLGDAMYKELVSKGPDAIPFLTQVLDGGQNAVDQLNTLDSALAKSAKGMADTASSALYQAAVDSAAGLVKGLQDQQAAIQAQMDKIAAGMVSAIKKKLGIRSPSREFAKVGNWSVEGLAQGLKDSKIADKAAESVGLSAIDSMRKSLTGLSGVIDGEIDTNPTISPVLDLTDIQKNAKLISKMMPTEPISVSAAYSNARNTVAAHNANQRALDNAAAFQGDGAGTTVNLTQNNYSPKALPAATIYRQTKNQMSKLKGALASNA